MINLEQAPSQVGGVKWTNYTRRSVLYLQVGEAPPSLRHVIDRLAESQIDSMKLHILSMNPNPNYHSTQIPDTLKALTRATPLRHLLTMSPTHPLTYGHSSSCHTLRLEAWLAMLIRTWSSQHKGVPQYDMPWVFQLDIPMTSDSPWTT